MRYALLILFIAANLHASARQRADTNLYRIIFCPSFSYTFPLGSFSARSGNMYYIGQAKSGPGFDLEVMVRCYKRFYAGFHFQYEALRLDDGKIYNQLASQFSQQGYYTTVKINANNAPGSQLKLEPYALELAYKARFNAMEIEPYIDIAACDLSAPINYYISDYMVHRKKIGENYAEDIAVNWGQSKTLFFPGIGLKANRQLTKHLAVSLAAQYNHGIAHYSALYIKTDYLNNTSQSSQAYTQPISALNVHAGLTVGVASSTRRRHHHRK